MFTLDLLNRLLGQVWYFLGLLNAQGQPLGFAPAGKPLLDLSFTSLFARLVKVSAENFAGQVLLGKEVIRFLMRVLVILPMT